MKHEEIPVHHEDPFIRFLHRCIRMAIKFLCVLMVLVIFWCIADVVYVLYTRLITPPLFLLDLEDILQTFGAFMAVLIAVEIFINIRLYLGTSVLPVQLVIATALMAIARKVVVLDLKIVSADQLLGIGVVTIALGVTYWLLDRKSHQETATKETEFP